MSQNYTPIDFLLPSPSASSHKEAEPALSAKDRAVVEMHEVVEHEIDKDVAEFVEHRKDTIEVPPDLKQMGVMPTGQATVTAHSTVPIPLTDEKIIKGIHEPLTSSVRWLAEFCLYILKSAHITLKEMHGKPVRVAG